LDKIQLLYSESHGRYILTVKADALDDILSKIDVDVQVIGEVKGDSLNINGHEFSFEDLDNAYHGVLEKYMP
jgi:phosphoribosylformylglycinamidine synthase